VTRPPETTTAFQLIHPTSPVQASASGKSATSSTIAAPTRRQHQSQQKRQGPMIQPSSATPHLLQPTTPAFPLALIASPNGAVASSAHDAATSGPNALRPVNRQPQQDDSIVERRHQTTFAGHPFTSVVYSRRNRLQSDADSVVNISHGDLLELEPNGSLYVVPAWYVIVNRGSRQLDIIEPKLLSEITSRVKSART
jgi:hypothetical protein